MMEEMFVQVSGCKLYAKLLGENAGIPTVIMDAGYGDCSKTWDSIIGEISTFANVFVYDRAGLGKSEPSSNPRTSKEMVKELKELLVKANITPPYIVVGHSFGGVTMRMFASEYRNDVCGLVLVDSTPGDYRERFLPTMSQEFQQAYNNQFVAEGNYDEFMESLKQVKEARCSLHVPLIVVSAGKKTHYSKVSQKLWNEMQAEILDISTDAELEIAENSGHYIQNDEPEIIIRAIKKLVEKV